MSYTTISEAQADVSSFVAVFTEAAAAIRPSLDVGTQTEVELGTFRAAVAETVGRFRVFRTDLDSTASADLLNTTQDAARLLAVWSWERDTRQAAQDFAVSVLAADSTARSLDGQSDRGTYTTRDGETLQSIAQAELGDFQAWTLILAANPDILPGLIPSGTTLVIPERR